MTIPNTGRTSIPATPSDRWPTSRLSWSAIFAGLLIALMTHVVLTLLGAAIGLAAWDPNSGKGLGIGAGIWALISMLIALFLGGATAGWLAGAHARTSAMLHGTMVWALTTLVTLWMVASGVGAIAGTTFRMVGNVVGATVGGAVQGSSAGITQAMQNQGGMTNIRSQLETLSRQNDSMFRQESLRIAAQMDTLKRETVQRAESVASVTSGALWLTLLGMLLSLAAAAFGARWAIGRDRSYEGLP